MLAFRSAALGLAVFAGLAAVPVLRADHFAIDLQATADKMSQPAHAERIALGEKPKARAVLDAHAGKRITVKWMLRCTDTKDTYKDVLVHFFAVKEEKAGQLAVPKLDKDVTAETALTMDFKPKDSSQGELSIIIDRPGVYLLRLETIGAAAGADGHEHFAALDLVVR